MEDLEEIKRLRKKLHENPEIAHHEIKTQEILKEFIKKNTSLKIVEENGYFYAYMKGLNPKRTIAIRTDMDAIVNSKNKPFHGCGHDGHMSIVCGSILALEKDKPNDNVIFLFQPAEENGEGAKMCYKMFENNDVEAIYGLHNMPGLDLNEIYYRKGCIQCASIGYHYEIKGKQSHASEPEKSHNPAFVISKMIEKLEPLNKYQGFKSFEFEGIEFSSLVLATIINVKVGEKNFGISPGSGEISLTLRTANDEDMDKLKAYLDRLVNDLCADKYTYKLDTCDEFPENNNDEKLCDETLKILDKHNLNYKELTLPFRASEDFGYYRRFCPSLFFMLGMGKVPSLHSEDYYFNDDIILKGISLFKAIAKN